MIGKITKIENDYYVMRVEEGDWETYYKINPDQQKELNDDYIDKKVDFIKSKNPNYIKIIFTDGETWDDIFKYIENNINEEFSVRVKNYITNTYLPPKKKINE